MYVHNARLKMADVFKKDRATVEIGRLINVESFLIICL